MVRENGRKKEQDSTSETEASGREQGPGRRDHEAREPKLQDYYEPSNKIKRYMDIVTGVIESVSGFLITKFFI